MTNTALQLGGAQSPSRLWRVLAIVGAVFMAVFLMIALNPGSGAFAQDITQCDAVGNGGGQGLECHVDIVNNLDLTDPLAPIKNSTVTVSSCLGGADAAAAGVCTTTGPITYSDVITNVDQCNASVNGGGATLLCTVEVLNNVTGGVTPVPATVNECNDSLDTGDVLNCDPLIPAPDKLTDPATATVIQCDNSVNGGGSVLDCSIAAGSTTSASLTVTVNQCNYSANGGGSVVVCRTRIRNATIDVATHVTTPPAATTVTPIDTTLLASYVPNTPPVVTPPAAPPVVSQDTTGGTSATSSRNRLVNTGSLASTGSDPAPAGLVAILVILLGITGLVTSKRIGFRKVG